MFNGASYPGHSWIDQNFSSWVLNDSSDFADATVSGRLFHCLINLIGDTFFNRFSLALWVDILRECPLFPVPCDILLFHKKLGTDMWS